MPMRGEISVSTSKERWSLSTPSKRATMFATSETDPRPMFCR